MLKKYLVTIICFLSFLNIATAQSKNNNKYPSLLWEITGNGLVRPSYLFGTMHVSNKMVFHLSDSFYHAIKNTETVALELNPDLWQSQMVRLDKLKENYAAFVMSAGNDYLNENSFRLNNYVDELKTALQSEPAIVNNLLYRSYKPKEDFEEDTFLDLYIFQTGRKLGKKAAGVENYYDAEKLVLEAYSDMAREKKKKTIDLDGESMGEMVQKVQNAYRRGDLDLMDSLDLLMEQSEAFREKFLYRRNEIQANSIDSIIKHTSLFAGVGAAHLPGNRGVIELLRKMGYKLRPVKMADRNASQKDIVDDLKVAVQFEKKYAEDNFYSVDVPGDLYKIKQDYQNLDRRQYADMSNGSYYIVTRVKTHAAFLGQSESDVLKKVDSVLYENIPGKILSKKPITKNNYDGYDITSRTRRGDRQRYQIFVTPFEVIIFKMSGKENYVEGPEALRFFSSITISENAGTAISFGPGHGGFSINFPHKPAESLNEADGRWEYEAYDKANGAAYLVLKKSVYNYNFIEEDSFDLSLIEASFNNPELFEKQVSRKQMIFKGYPSLEVSEKLKNGYFINARFIINGPHYYVIAQRTDKPDSASFNAYINSFRFSDYKYSPPKIYNDSFLRASVMSPVVPDIDEEFRKLIEQASDDAFNGNNSSGYISYWPKAKNGIFRSDSTGEMITVRVQEYPIYFSIRDSSKFWQNEIDETLNKGDMQLKGDVEHINGQDYSGLRFSVKDTSSSRIISQMFVLKNNFLYSITGIGDSINGSGLFSTSFFNSFRPTNTNDRNLYQSRLNNFFIDLFSSDSAIQNKARQSLSNIYYGPAGIPMIVHSLSQLNYNDRNYFETKTRLIAELGFIKDSSSDILVRHLKKLYDQAGDTVLFRNEVVKSLARLKTKASFRLLKEIFLQDPPIFENTYDYNSLFDHLRDTLALSATLFPEMLTLFSLDDYKEKIIGLLVDIADSGFISPQTYKAYFPNIYIDAKVALKKLRARDEKEMRNAKKTDAEDETITRSSGYGSDVNTLRNYSILLMPYYGKNKNVPLYFSGLLNSRNQEVKMNTAVLMIRNGQVVADSLLLAIAADDRFRGLLLTGLEKAGHADKFPKQFKTQHFIARSLLAQQNEYDDIDSIVFLLRDAASLKGKAGFVYFYKYRIKKSDPWKIGLSGLQPLNEHEVSSDDELVAMSDTRLKDDEPISGQLKMQLKKSLFTFHKSGKYFYNERESYPNFNR